MPVSVPKDALRVMPDALREFATEAFLSAGLPNVELKPFQLYWRNRYARSS